MKATIRTFESGIGDCIFLVLKNEEKNESYHIMIDCNTFTPDIKQFVTESLNKRIDSLIITHVDSDHINGLIQMLQCDELADMTIDNIFFNCFQPQSEQPVPTPEKDIERLDALPHLLYPSVDENYKKCSGKNAASFIQQLNLHPTWKASWRKKTILAGDIIPLGDGWGDLHFVSPSQDDIDSWFLDLKVEYAKIIGRAPLDVEFENQDLYYELMSLVLGQKRTPVSSIKNGSEIISDLTLQKYACIDAEEKKVTKANKASLAFFWQGGQSRVLFMGDAVSSTVMPYLNELGEGEIYFDAIKIAHHASRFNTSIAFAKKVNTCHYFLTGGKKGDGPNLETISKFIMRDVCEPENRHIFHYNHSKGVELINKLLSPESEQILNSHDFYLSNDNKYTFEY